MLASGPLTSLAQSASAGLKSLTRPKGFQNQTDFNDVLEKASSDEQTSKAPKGKAVHKPAPRSDDPAPTPDGTSLCCGVPPLPGQIALPDQPEMGRSISFNSNGPEGLEGAPALAMPEGPSGAGEAPLVRSVTPVLIPQKTPILPPTPDANSHGTDAAKQEPDMTRALKMNEFAASAEQILPEEFAPSQGSGVEDPLHRVDPPMRGLESNYIQWNPVGPQETDPLDIVDATPVAPTATNELYHSVLEQAAILKHVRGDAMTVVLKPDAHTEILLQLSKTEDGISATLRVDRGHVTGLADDWAQLANSLSHQGVQLICSSENSASFRGGHSDRHHAPPGFGMDELAEKRPQKSETKKPVSSRMLRQTSGSLEIWA